MMKALLMLAIVGAILLVAWGVETLRDSRPDLFRVLVAVLSGTLTGALVAGLLLAVLYLVGR